MVYAPGAGPDLVKYGPGKVYAGAVGSTEPTDLTAALAAAWVYIGYTDTGHTFTYTPSYENIEVAETLLPIAKVATGQEYTVEFAFAEIHAGNIQKAFNGGTVTASGTAGTSIEKFEPLAFGVTETRIALLWEADDKSERWVFRRCLQTGAVAVQRQRGAAKSTIPVTFSLETPSGGVKPFMSLTKATAAL